MSDKAVALQYDNTTSKAPKVLASGRNDIARTIIEKAKEFDVPLFANEMLVDSLINLEIDHEIPQELYQGVSDVFIWLMRNEKKFKEKF